MVNGGAIFAYGNSDVELWYVNERNFVAKPITQSKRELGLPTIGNIDRVIYQLGNRLIVEGSIRAPRRGSTQLISVDPRGGGQFDFVPLFDDDGKTSGGPDQITAHNNKLYFYYERQFPANYGNPAYSPNQGEIWVSDGTVRGTKQLTQLSKRSSNRSYPAAVKSLTSTDLGLVFFKRVDPSQGAVEVSLLDPRNGRIQSLTKDIHYSSGQDLIRGVRNREVFAVGQDTIAFKAAVDFSNRALFLGAPNARNFRKIKTDNWVIKNKTSYINGTYLIFGKLNGSGNGLLGINERS